MEAMRVASMVGDSEGKNARSARTILLHGFRSDLPFRAHFIIYSTNQESRLG